VLTPSALQPSYVDTILGAPGYFQLDPNIALTDSDGTSFFYAKVKIISGFESSDVLSLITRWDSVGSITSSYNKDTGELTLMPVGVQPTLEQWQTALRSVVYRPVEPITTTQKKISFVISDGTTESQAALKTIAITPFNDPPQIGVGRVTFDFGSNDYASAISILPGGQYSVAGVSNSTSGTTKFATTRFNSDGSLDTGFGNQGKNLADFDGTGGYIYKILPLDGGKFLAFGYTIQDRSLGQTAWAVARYNADGSLDTTFDTDGRQSFDYSNYSSLDVATVRSDGKILIAGDKASNNDPNSDWYYQAAVVRLNSDGSPDMGFGTGGVVTIPRGDAASGSSEGAYIGIFALSNGKTLVVSEYRNDLSGQTGIALTRLNVDGTADASFGQNGKVTSDLSNSLNEIWEPVFASAAMLPDGRIVCLIRSFNKDQFSWAAKTQIVRFNTDGSLDRSFGAEGLVEVGSNSSGVYFSSMTVQTDGRILLYGSKDQDFFVERHNSNGTLDTSFGIGGSLKFVFGACDSES
jgi:uncharacterized delta-60 repeat protein